MSDASHTPPQSRPYRRAGDRPPLLGPEDPPPFEVYNAEAACPLLLLCDHAGRAVPKALDGLGVNREVFDLHVAWDIGAARLTHMLSERLGAPAVLANYSRLVIDLNRQPGDPSSVPGISDGVRIPANEGLTEAALDARTETFFRPYHNAITDVLAHLWRKAGVPPAVFSIHSFTPTIGGHERPWHAGVLWNRDPRMAKPLISALRSHRGLVIGDNEPYDGKEIAYTIDRHAGAAGLPNCAVEVRQDLITDAEGISEWAAILGAGLERVLGVRGLHRVEHF